MVNVLPSTPYKVAWSLLFNFGNVSIFPLRRN